jgi:hypothetical protein
MAKLARIARRDREAVFPLVKAAEMVRRLPPSGGRARESGKPALVPRTYFAASARAAFAAAFSIRRDSTFQ